MSSDQSPGASQASPDSAGEDGYRILGDALRDGCIELMTNYGLSAILQASGTAGALEGGTAFATVDFQGHDIRGTIGLTLAHSVLAQTYRVALGVDVRPGSLEASDWACELIRTREDLSLVICDVNMPRMNGLDMLDAVQDQIRQQHLPVLMLTTEGQPEAMMRARKSGAKGWIVKPFKEDLLLLAVQKLTRAGPA